MKRRSKAIATLYPKGDLVISSVWKERCLPFPVDIFLRCSSDVCGFQVANDILEVALKRVMLNLGYPNFNKRKEDDKEEVH